MAGWRFEVNKSGTFSSRDFFDLGFDLALNQPGSWHAHVVTGANAPEKGDEVKLWWDKGGGNERLWVRGVIASAQEDPLTKTYRLRGYDDSLFLAQSTLGDIRKFDAQTPYTIIQSSGSPKGLLYNAQSNLVMAYGTTAPNAITGAAPGNSLKFRASTGNTLLNIARLCEQATHGGGPTHGLEWFVDRDGADALRFNLVTRRERSVGHTAETWQIGQDLFQAPHERFHDTDYNRVRVIGEGTGSSRVESAWKGAGSRELVFTDKNVYDATTAGNLAQRILNAMNQGATPNIVAKTHKHVFTTTVGDDVSVVPVGGGGGTTRRVFGIRYEFRERAFTLEIGRSRRFFTTYLRDLVRDADAIGLHPQLTDTARRSANQTTTGQPQTSTGTVADGASQTTTAVFDLQDLDVAADDALDLRVSVAATAGSLVDVKVDLRVGAGGTSGTLYDARHRIPGGGTLRFPIHVDAASLGVSGMYGFSPTDVIDRAIVTVTNRNGANLSITTDVSGAVARPHRHND